MSWLRLCSGFALISIAYSAAVDEKDCDLPSELIYEIQGYKGFVDQITSAATTGSYSGVFYKDLAFFTDKFGSRKTGSQILDLSVKYLDSILTRRNLRTRLENVSVPLWLRGKEKAYYITSFRKKKLRVKALGGSGSGNVTGPLLIVSDVEELEDRKEEVTGRVVLFNTEFTNYEQTAVSRFEGPARASEYGAVAALVRSITPFSIGSIHVGAMDFTAALPIPAAAISLEDADILYRLTERERVLINLIIENKEETDDRDSQNLIIDLPGTSQPLCTVTLSGHIDSWDVGQGALDDGGGAFLAFHSLLLLKHLNIPPPKRTIRAILWTGEEMGLYGAKSYAELHPEELKQWVAAFESDAGLFEPIGLRTNANEHASCILKQITSLFTGINATALERTQEKISSDISVFQRFNIPLMEPLMKPNNYFWFHHTYGDSMRVMNSTLMDRHLVMAAGTAYILANLSVPLHSYEPETYDGDYERRSPKENHRRSLQNQGS